MALHHIFFSIGGAPFRALCHVLPHIEASKRALLCSSFKQPTFLIFLLPTIFGRSIWSNCFFLVILCVFVYIAGGGFTHLLIYHYPITPSPLPISLKVLSHCIANYTWSISTSLSSSFCSPRSVLVLLFYIPLSLHPRYLSLSLSSYLYCHSLYTVALRLYLIVKAEPFIGC